MGFLLEEYVRSRARSSVKATGMSARRMLESQTTSTLPRYDVFLSQAIRDEDLVLGVYSILTEDLGLSVFCDWLQASQADHSVTTPADVEHIRRMMLASTALIFIDSEHSKSSTWMSWEIGWFHGAKRRVCVLPVVRSEGSPHRGREFLGLYPAVEEDDRYTLRVPSRITDLTARFPPGTPLGLATSMPLRLWATAEALPDIFLA
ncbi:hypothetical protein HJA95_08440 [Rhizobium binae]|uniref:hypothetical protein n=1 Tax=Rhizobium binae TaxID=1138190 RepID=UPI001C8319BF|nr:hypothetical protein [Rhizobium binae]MBX4949607.1 hypothetical protein [Rhizobium binae]